MYELHVISDGSMPLEQFADIAGGIHPYVTTLHLREKHRTALEIWNGVQLLLERGVPSGKISINDRLDVAWMSGIGGIHLASHSVPLQPVARLKPTHALTVGRSVHSLEEAVECAIDGADYMFYGHVYESRSKPGIAPRGLQQLQIVASSLKIPIIAIGGITLERIDEVLDHGASGVAVISSILHAADPKSAARELFDKLEERRLTDARDEIS